MGYSKQVIILASNNKIVIEGLTSLIEEEDIAEVLSICPVSQEELGEAIKIQKPMFVFVDNRSSDITIESLSDLIEKEKLDTKIIIFSEPFKEQIDSSNVIFIDKKTDFQKFKNNF